MRTLPDAARWLLLAFALTSPAAWAADALVGEWALSQEQCESTRIVYTADGGNEAWMKSDGSWNRLSSGTYSHEGAELVVEAQGQSDKLHIIRLDDGVLEIRNADKARMEQISRDSVSFVRRPAR